MDFIGGVLLSKKIRIIIIILLIILFSIIFAIVRLYNDTSKTGVKSESKVENIEQILSVSNGNGERLFRSKGGFMGVIDKNDELLVEPVWSNIVFVSTNTYIVSKSENGNYKYGMIDKSENLIVPVIYDKLSIVQDDIILGEINYKNKSKSIVFDFLGNSYFNKEWDKVTFKNNYIELKLDEDIFKAKLQNNYMFIRNMSVKKELSNKSINFNIYNVFDFKRQTIAVYEDLIDNSISYIEALFNDNIEVIKKLNHNDFNINNKLNIELKGAIIDSINSNEISIEKTSNGIYNYKSEIGLTYTFPETIFQDGTVNTNTKSIVFIIFMKKNIDGKLRVYEIVTHE